MVNVERYVRGVAQGSMQVQQVIVDIDSFEQGLYAVLLAADMPDVPFVLLIQRVHDAVHHQRCLPAEFLQFHEHAVVSRPAHRVLPQPVFHLNGKLCRFILIYHIKGIEAAVSRNDREVRLTLKALYGRLDTYHILRPRSFVGNDVVGAQIHIFHFRREQDMYGLRESHLDEVRCDNLIGGENPCFHGFLRLYRQYGQKHY